uniref:Uncharacterized protein n=1 Tax=Arundo donax TaxID=35708 RepID=A0A0A8ZAS9_ARUDO
MTTICDAARDLEVFVKLPSECSHECALS